MSSEHSRIKQSAKNLPHYPGSYYSKEFIQNHLGEFQCHLQRIAHYLVHGEGVWWNKSANGTVMFLDSDLDPEYHTEGPNVLHFRSASLKDVSIRATECWNKVGLPITAVRDYDSCSGSVLNVTELGQTSSDLETLDSQTDVSKAMDTTLLNTEGPTHAHSSVSELWSVSNESIPMPLTTSTPQRNQCTPVEQESATDGNEKPEESESTAVQSEVTNSPKQSQTTTTAMTQSSHGSQTIPQATGNKYTFQSKLANTLSTTVGISPELKSLDELKTAGNTNSNEYKMLKHFFRRKLVYLRTGLQKEIIELERNKQKKTQMYKKLSNDLKKATVLLTHTGKLGHRYEWQTGAYGAEYLN